jgi:ribosome recycling factor
MNQVKQAVEEKMKKTIASFKEEMAALRTGRASASIFDRISVDCYGQKTPLNQVASVSVPEARLIVIQPWDKSLLGEIEKAIQKSELSLNPSNDGKVIRISIPPLTEERRKDLVKTVKNDAEQYRVSLRNNRRDANEDLKKLLKDSVISEDDEKRGIDEIQKMTDRYIEELNKILAEKEKEIMQV